jgi:hypothetical protein
MLHLQAIAMLIGAAIPIGGCAGELEPADADELADEEEASESSSEALAASGYVNTFESGQLDLNCSGNCPTVASKPVFEGSRAASFELTRSMNVPYRTEAVLADGTFEFGKDYWVGFAYRFEDWASDTSREAAPFQIHQRPSNWDLHTECSSNSAYSTAPVFMSVANNRAEIVTYGGKRLWEGAVQPRAWQRLVMHFRASTGKDGLVEIWKDGVKLGAVAGANVPVVDRCGYPFLAPYLKVGIYKWDWKAGRKATQSTRRHLMIDNIRMIAGANRFADVQP